jgi:hypothetical protein
MTMAATTTMSMDGPTVRCRFCTQRFVGFERLKEHVMRGHVKAWRAIVAWLGEAPKGRVRQ